MKTWHWWGLGILLLGAFAYMYRWEIATLLAPVVKQIEQTEAPPASAFTLPQGFSATVFSSEAPGARVLTRDPKGVLVASLTSEGKVVAFPDTNSDGVSDGTVTILDGLKGPHGIAFRCGELGKLTDATTPCYLFVAESNQLVLYVYNPDTFATDRLGALATFPDDGGHTTRTILLHPDGKTVLVSVGSSCNVCNEKDPERATVLAVDMTTKETRTYAKGLRNTVFMALNPVTGDVWGTEMGRDLLGDDVPPDEVNILGGPSITSGQNSIPNFGWPICYGKNVHDDEFDKNVYVRNPCMEPFEVPSAIDLQAHSAPLGLAFVPEEGWPEEYWNDLLIAYHGSWNRSEPTGYKVVHIPLTNGKLPASAPQDFMVGFMNSEGEVIGRPAGLLAEPGGVLYVSDDRAGAIYRITRTELE